jgi:low affinity Fe/Cu permease
MRIKKMAEQEKDNTMTVVIAVTLIAIVGVFLLKSRETEHLQYSGEANIQQEAEVLKAHKDYNNDVLSQAE